MKESNIKKKGRALERAQKVGVHALHAVVLFYLNHRIIPQNL